MRETYLGLPIPRLSNYRVASRDACIFMLLLYVIKQSAARCEACTRDKCRRVVSHCIARYRATNALNVR